jgi:calcineurin-like phosphoesterase family protein
MKRVTIVTVSALVSALTAVCAGAAATASGDPVVAAAGDISDDSFSGQSRTDELVVNKGLDAVLTLGDNQYSDGSLSDFQQYYDPTWGRVKWITYPSPGNHDDWGESGYDEYFGVPRYYAWNIGAWRLYALDSNSVDSTQVNWLKSNLAANPHRCVAAYWHHPTFSSGSHGSDSRTRPFWDALYAAHADLVLVGHDHTYERFARQTPSGQWDGVRGIREFVVGTGGKSHYGFDSPIANSQVRNDDTFGVLKLTLHAYSYDWRFVPEAGKTFTDSGSRTCSL